MSPSLVTLLHCCVPLILTANGHAFATTITHKPSSNSVPVLQSMGKTQPLITKTAQDASSPDRVIATTTGRNHSCALSANGTVRCWGDNGAGQLSKNPMQVPSSSTPIVVDGVKAIAITARFNHTCALQKNHTVSCWGSNSLGQLGRPLYISGPSYIPALVSLEGTQPLRPVSMVSAGGEHTCAVLKNKTLWCWGDNSTGQLARDPTQTPYSPLPLAVNGIPNAISVSASYNHTCALLKNNTVSCWGNNGSGQLGRDPAATTSTHMPAVVTVDGLSPLKNVLHLSTGGEEHSCAVLKNSTVQCWGNNISGQLGSDPAVIPSSYKPLLVNIDTAEDKSTLLALATGKAHSCALKNSGVIWCWGNNHFIQLGEGSRTAAFARQQDTFVPVRVPSANPDKTLKNTVKTISISAGDNHNCAVQNNGKLFCWGSNHIGQLGNGGLLKSAIPVPITDIKKAQDANAGGFHTCAVLNDGSVHCWGNNNLGQLGNDTTINSAVPVRAVGIGSEKDEIPATLVHSGDYHTCAILKDGSVRCWGYGGYGQMGHPDAPPVSLVPVRVLGIGSNADLGEIPAIALSGGGFFSCALLVDGSVRCWGRNGANQLGTMGESTPMPATVPGLDKAIAISSGHEHTCAVLSDKTVRCWGYNFNGQLGNGMGGPGTNSAIPVIVTGIDNVVGIGSGDSHTCAVLNNGTVRCWGDNQLGQLGNGESISSTTPVSVSGLQNVIAIGAGQYHTCALLGDGTVRCWGGHNTGQLGNGLATINYSSTPVAVSGIHTATAISAGDSHACALLVGDTLSCWGDNSLGQLGIPAFFKGNRPLFTVGLPEPRSAGQAPRGRYTK